MPITAERMQLVIDLASECLEKSETAKKIFKSILTDANGLRNRLNEKQIEDEMIDELVFSITILARDAGEMCTVDASHAQELGAERARFEINQGKHRNAAERMRQMRKRERLGIKEKREEKEQPLSQAEIAERLKRIDVIPVNETREVVLSREERTIETITESEAIDENWLLKTGEKE